MGSPTFETGRKGGEERYCSFGRRKIAVHPDGYFVQKNTLQNDEGAAAGGHFQGACGSGDTGQLGQLVVLTQDQLLAV